MKRPRFTISSLMVIVLVAGVNFYVWSKCVGRRVVPTKMVAMAGVFYYDTSDGGVIEWDGRPDHPGVLIRGSPSLNRLSTYAPAFVLTAASLVGVTFWLRRASKRSVPDR